MRDNLRHHSLLSLELVEAIALEIRKIVEDIEVYDSELSGAEVLTTCLLAHTLGYVYGEPSTVVRGLFDGQKHTWLTWNGFIIDLTATQFGANKRCYCSSWDNRYQAEHSIPIHNFGLFRKDNIRLLEMLDWRTEYDVCLEEAQNVGKKFLNEY